ncbi:MAG: hypothetical protein IPN13_17155 [Bacteroidetes bacterium]|nr:hypothetical protein [Bacteroidota bacterium]
MIQKEGVDAQSNSININVTDCSFGKFFTNETIVRHNSETGHLHTLIRSIYFMQQMIPMIVYRNTG